MKRFIAIMMMCLTMSGCAGFERGCSSTMATSFGSDWAVVELTEQRGTPYRCWTLEGVSVANEEMSDGIYWKTRKGHLVHISGSYDYVQVKNKDWEGALAEINLTPSACRAINKARYDVKAGVYK